MDNEYGEQSQPPGPGAAPQYQYQPPAPPDDARPDVDSLDQTQTMPAALEELPPYGQSAFAGSAPQPPMPSTPPPPYGQPNYGQPAAAPDAYGSPATGYNQATPSYSGQPSYPAQPPYPGPSYADPANQPTAYQQPSYPAANADQSTSTYPPVGGGYGAEQSGYGAPNLDRPPVPMPPPGYQPTQSYPPAGGGYGQPEYGQGGGYGQPEAYGTAASGYPAQDYGNYEAPYGGQQSPDPAYGYQPAGDQYRQSPGAPQYGGATDTATTTRAAAREAQPHKSHIGLWTLLVVAVVVVIVVVATFLIKPSFLFKKVLDHSAVEQTIESQSKGSATPLTDVSCPANEKVKAGVTFQCTAAGNKKVNVTIKDSKANYQWSIAS
jgi:hypothetical protein